MKNQVFFILIGWVLLFIILGTATVHYRYSDPFYVTEVTDRLLTQFRVDLEDFENLDRIHPGQRVEFIEGKPYHYYPLGAALAQVPGVIAAKTLGLIPYENDSVIQKWNSIFILTLCWLVFALTVLRLYPQSNTRLLGLILFLASPIIGSLGTAMWSTTPALLIYFCILSLLLQTVYHEQLSSRQQWVLGFLLGGAVLFRPTCLAAIVPAFFLLRHYQNKAVTKVMCAAVLSFIICLLVFRAFYGTFRPPYLTAHEDATFEPLVAFLGMLFSPSRGFFIYAPTFILTALGFVLALYKMKNTQEQTLCYCLALWVGIHWLGIMLVAPSWTGGWCFGPRLLVETMPMWLFLTLILQQQFSVTQTIVFRWVVMLCLIWSAFVNIIQSQYNPYTSYWNESISIQHFPEVLWDWEYPPFLNSQDRSNDRFDKYGITHF